MRATAPPWVSRRIFADGFERAGHWETVDELRDRGIAVDRKTTVTGVEVGTHRVHAVTGATVLGSTTVDVTMADPILASALDLAVESSIYNATTGVYLLALPSAGAERAVTATVDGAAHATPLCELELELLQGPPEALLALARRARDGGSYHVQVSLCQSGMFIYRQGKTEFDAPDINLSDAELDALRAESETADGKLRHLGPVLRLSETEPHWSHPTPVLGGHAAEWLSPAAAAAAAE